MAFNQRLIVVQIPINAREKRKRKKRSFAHFVFNFCSFRFCDYRCYYFKYRIKADYHFQLDHACIYITNKCGYIYTICKTGIINDLTICFSIRNENLNVLRNVWSAVWTGRAVTRFSSNPLRPTFSGRPCPRTASHG